MPPKYKGEEPQRANSLEGSAMDQLRAIVRQADAWCEAQLLELDIAVAADSVEKLLQEIEYTLVLEYQIARERGQTPFAGIAHKTPKEYRLWWEAGTSTAVEHELHVPAEVIDALAIALHSHRKPTVVIQRYAHAA